MFRYLERSENTARLVEAGFRIALTQPESAADEWASVLTSAGTRASYDAANSGYDSARVVDFMLRDRDNPSSVLSCIETARTNARLVRTALTREVWEAVNESWMTLREILARPVREKDLPEVLGTIRRQSALVRGAQHGTMLRNDAYDFCRIGTLLERADSTARILDVKYYVLLPSIHHIGSTLDNVQWETILRSVAGERAFRWLTAGYPTPRAIADFLILDGRMPRSLSFCMAKLSTNLDYLQRQYGERHPCHEQAAELRARLSGTPIDAIFERGLHEFILEFLSDIGRLARQIEDDYRFYR